MDKPTTIPEHRTTIRILRGANVVFSRVYHQLDVVSPPQLPRRGPGILVCNHISGLDPALIQSVCRRMIVWMMAREYYSVPGMRWLFKQVQVIPVDRDRRDLSAMRLALTALRDGRILGIFPEGRLETSRQLIPFQTGVALIALKTAVDVYPAYLDGTQRNLSMLQACFVPQHATIAFGARIALGKTAHRNDAERATQTIQSAVATLQQRVWERIVEKNLNKITKDGKK
jgi:1-acyl-sn-glycerol-3-phosphate acyltransferase